MQRAIKAIIRAFNNDPHHYYTCRKILLTDDPIHYQQVEPAELASIAVNALEIYELGWCCECNPSKILDDPCKCPESAYTVFRLKGAEDVL